MPSAPLTALDPIWTTAAVTRVHGYLVFDSLFGLDATFKPRPQMAAGARQDDDGLTWTVTLRSGLTFHDNVLRRHAMAGRAVILLPRFAAATERADGLDAVERLVGFLVSRMQAFRDPHLATAST